MHISDFGFPPSISPKINHDTCNAKTLSHHAFPEIPSLCICITCLISLVLCLSFPLRFTTEEAASSMISSVQRNVALETSDSNDNNNALRHANKRMRLDNDVSFAKFKGVVPQQNGHWGAQIYENHQRIWLGTFKSEKEAAMAYDSAAIKLRNGKDLHRNFPWTNFTIQEPDFQNHYTTDAIIKMIRDGSYASKFDAFVRSHTQAQTVEMGKGPNPIRVHGDGQILCRQLFQKELTPSDVGKLNRLVIPKKYAVEYFPCICENVEENGIDDIELVFYDKLMRVWKFRYCYWRSSQSFVFTRGWNRFVKENNLKANDVITFCTCEGVDQPREEDREGATFWLIDVMHCEDESKRSCVVEEGVNECEDLQVKLELNLGEKRSCKVQQAGEKGFRLFGVNINKLRR